MDWQENQISFIVPFYTAVLCGLWNKTDWPLSTIFLSAPPLHCRPSFVLYVYTICMCDCLLFCTCLLGSGVSGRIKHSNIVSLVAARNDCVICCSVSFSSLPAFPFFFTICCSSYLASATVHTLYEHPLDMTWGLNDAL